MAFCVKCGVMIPDGYQMCKKCGEEQQNRAWQAPPAYNQPPQYGWQPQYNTQPAPHVYPEKFGPQAYSPPPAAVNKEANKGLAVFAYFGLLFLIPLVAAKDSEFAKYHVNQGLALWISEIVFTILAYAAMIVLTIVLETMRVSIIFVAVFYAIAIVFLIFMIIGVVHAARGEMKPLPFFGKVKIIK